MKTKVKFSDLKDGDLELLAKAYSANKELSTCFANSYRRLRELDLITDDMKISWYGKKLLKYLDEVN